MKNDDLTFLLSGVSSAIVCPTKFDLYEEALSKSEACIASNGQLCVATGQHTGRAAEDKYIVNSSYKLAELVEYGVAGKACPPERFENLASRIQAYLHGRKVYVVDLFAGPIKCRVITELAWHALFVSNLFQTSPEPFKSDEDVHLTIVAVPGCTSGGKTLGFRSDTAIVSHLEEGTVLIVGTAYAGEIKKSIFSFASFVLSLQNDLPMHSSVTAKISGESSVVFFGLSGTGKTTLSAESNDPQRGLLGDDEHVWIENGIYNIENGCYAKAINLSPEKEPQIHKACSSFMTVLENVMLNADRSPDFASSHVTENTRAAYPLSVIEGSLKSGQIVNHPEHIIMLTCDAYGVLPSVASLSHEAAVYHFLSGYTAKVAGTEAGIKEPKATFSRCFGAPFMPLKSKLYADILIQKLKLHQPRVWLVNTGWVGGPYGSGSRINIDITRQIIDDIVSGKLSEAKFKHLDELNLDVPEGVPYSEPTWFDTAAYSSARAELIKLFQENAAKVMQGLDETILNAGPGAVQQNKATQ